MAPYLKSIMGYWLIAQCDTYSPASSAAKVAFETAFPSSKQPEALAFCKEDVLNVSLHSMSSKFYASMGHLLMKTEVFFFL